MTFVDLEYRLRQTEHMLYLVGAGLGSIDDLTIQGQNVLQKSDFVYLDAYTSIILGLQDDLQGMCGKIVIPADREMVEQTEEIINRSKNSDVSFVVVGDPLGATTHTDLIMRAIEANVPYKIVHNTSIITAVGCCGLQLYNFGSTVSIPLWDEYGSPESYFDKIEANFSRGLHTLCLLDIKVKEQSLENLLRGRKVYEKPRFMTCQQAAHQILQIMSKRQTTQVKENDRNKNIPTLTQLCLTIGLARVGSDDQKVVISTIDNLSEAFINPEVHGDPLGGPLHSLIIPGLISPFEADFLLARYKFQVSYHSSLPEIFICPPSDSGNHFSDLTTLISRHNSVFKTTEKFVS